METTMQDKALTTHAVVITPDALLSHWQGHRYVTRRVIEAFPEDKLFTYTIGDICPFAALVMEMVAMAIPSIKGVISGEWKTLKDENPQKQKNELLHLSICGMRCLKK